MHFTFWPYVRTGKNFVYKRETWRPSPNHREREESLGFYIIEWSSSGCTWPIGMAKKNNRVLMASVIDCQLIPLIDTHDRHLDRMTSWHLDQHLIDSRLSTDCRLSVHGVSTEVSMECRSRVFIDTRLRMPLVHMIQEEFLAHYSSEIKDWSDITNLKLC